jgi:NADH-quinone oxidoreductase subunit C
MQKPVGKIDGESSEMASTNPSSGSNDEDKPQPNARRGPQIQLAPEALDNDGIALSILLTEALAPHGPVMGVAVDQVVVEVAVEQLEAAAFTLRNNPELNFNYFRCLATVDYQEYLELVYLLYSTEFRYQIMFKTNIEYTSGDIPTVTVPSLHKIWPAADWHERESHDLFGVLFSGHPNMEPLLLYEEFEGFPGLKSFPFNEYEDW